MMRDRKTDRQPSRAIAVNRPHTGSVDRELTELLARARAAVAAMTPEQRAEMYRRQRESWGHGQDAIGSDADEAAYRAAVEAGMRELLRSSMRQRKSACGSLGKL